MVRRGVWVLWVVTVVVVMAGATWAGGFSGYVAEGLFYREVEIVAGVPEVVGNNRRGKVVYAPVWLLSGVIEGGPRGFGGGVVWFFGQSCSGGDTYWSVGVAVPALAAGMEWPFLKFVANAEPARACSLKVVVHGR